MTAAPGIYIYGAGRMGREVLAHCRRSGIEPRAFIDRAADRLVYVDGLRILSPDMAIDGRGSEAVIALHSPGVDVAYVAADLARHAFDRTQTLWSFCARHGWLPRSSFWIEPDFAWADHEAPIIAARGLLIDDRSRRVFDQQIALRRDGNYAGLDVPTPEDQYVPMDLPRWREPMCLIDAGAFDGDTVRSLERAGYTIEELVALEPDPVNFARLVAACGHRSGTRLVEAGAAATGGSRYFSAGEGGAAHIDAAGETPIAVVTIDALCSAFKPTLIKMDIEGAEQEALDGAAATLQRDRPDVAISVYHRVHDLWTIPLAIARTVASYRFALRSHALNGFDTVLYGWAT